MCSENLVGGILLRQVELRFGPDLRARLRLDVRIPQGAGPFPVFMTQPGLEPWAALAVTRGYLACVYAASDACDDTDSFLAAYPDADWSRLTRRAWAVSRCVDYLAQVAEADTHRIALAGHSRNGKQSLIAAALDERISVVISGSSGAGGAMSARYFSDAEQGESIEFLTRGFPEWFHPRFRFFAGREHKLPVDMHELVALVAPRACLLSVAHNDGCESVWAMERTYLAARRVYRWLGAGDALRILRRAGGHPASLDEVGRYLDWCDAHLRGTDLDATNLVPGGRFPETFLYPWDWESWAHNYGAANPAQGPPSPWTAGGASDVSSWERQRAILRDRVLGMLGVPSSEDGTARSEAGPVDIPLEHGVERRQLVFGGGLRGDVYLPSGRPTAGERLPGVLWLHPWCTSYGYAAMYRQGPEPFQRMARAGFAVFCFDQVGCGSRVEEVADFYGRHARWSLLGEMVRDAGWALEAFAALPYVDAARVCAIGYSLGAMVGLHLAALDTGRLAGLGVVCPPAPFGTVADQNAAIAYWSKVTMLLPQLGRFAGERSMVPYDIHDLLACLAPRPTLAVTPRWDRYCGIDAAQRAVDDARGACALHGVPHHLTHLVPEDYHRFSPETQDLVLAWLQRQFGSATEIPPSREALGRRHEVSPESGPPPTAGSRRS